MNLQDIQSLLEPIREDSAEIKKTLADQHIVLREHIRRTEANEEQIALMRADIGPLKTHVAMFGAVAKFVTFLGTLLGLAVGLWKLVH